MKDKKEPTQKTPQGYEIPIPTRKDVEEALDKAAKKPSQADSPKK